MGPDLHGMKQGMKPGVAGWPDTRELPEKPTKPCLLPLPGLFTCCIQQGSCHLRMLWNKCKSPSSPPRAFHPSSSFTGAPIAGACRDAEKQPCRPGSTTFQLKHRASWQDG